MHPRRFEPHREKRDNNWLVASVFHQRSSKPLTGREKGDRSSEKQLSFLHPGCGECCGLINTIPGFIPRFFGVELSWLSGCHGRVGCIPLQQLPLDSVRWMLASPMRFRILRCTEFYGALRTLHHNATTGRPEARDRVVWTEMGMLALNSICVRMAVQMSGDFALKSIDLDRHCERIHGKSLIDVAGYVCSA